MTWTRAAPVLAVSAVFDAFRLIFEMFWFFGPALAALYCTIKASGALEAWTFGLLGTNTAALACAAGAGAIGAMGVGIIAPFGVVMAMATGLAGWLTVGITLLVTNGRIFKENALWFAGGLLVSEIPIVGSIPAITLVVWKMYRTQIRIEKEALKKFEKERTEEQRHQAAAQLAHARMGQEAANDAEYGIPEEAREAA